MSRFEPLAEYLLSGLHDKDIVNEYGPEEIGTLANLIQEYYNANKARLELTKLEQSN